MGPAAAGERRYQLLDGTEQHHRRCQLCHGDPTGHPELPGCTLTEAQTESLDLTGFPKLRSLDISGIAAWQQLPQLPEERIRLLDISHTAVTDIRTLTEASYHDLILSYQATMDWETLGVCNTYQFTVLDCPLDRQVAVRTALENRVEYATELPVQSDELLSKTMRGEISFS